MPAETNSVQDMTDNAEGRLEDVKVLIVDDDRDVLESFEAAFQSEGALTQISMDGNDAVRICHDDPPDIVVLDMRLPDISGPDVARQAWRRWPDLPILFISAYPEPALRDAATEELVQDFLCKPFTRDQLVDAVLRLLPASLNGQHP